MTVSDKGWVYGVWYCGTAWTKARLHGEYPATFLKRVYALFPDATRILHCPSGTVNGRGVTVDMVHDGIRVPQIVADAHVLPFKPHSFDLILADPPYSLMDSKIYGVPAFRVPTFMTEAHRVLDPGGYLGILHTYYPSYHGKIWALEGLIAVVTGFLRVTRMFSIFRKLSP